MMAGQKTKGVQFSLEAVQATFLLCVPRVGHSTIIELN